MFTAQEIEIKVRQKVRDLEPSTKFSEGKLYDLIAYGCHFSVAREICARRARKLRKRGEDVKFYLNTRNGKARYTWELRIPPWDVVLVPNGEAKGRE